MIFNRNNKFHIFIKYTYVVVKFVITIIAYFNKASLIILCVNKVISAFEISIATNICYSPFVVFCLYSKFIPIRNNFYIFVYCVKYNISVIISNTFKLFCTAYYRIFAVITFVIYPLTCFNRTCCHWVGCFSKCVYSIYSCYCSCYK